MMQEPSRSQVVDVVASLGGVARTTEILDAGVHPRVLYAARDAGVLVELARGVFRLAALDLHEPDLVVVAQRMPAAVLCVVTALHLHGLTAEIPRAVHVALPRGRHPARLTHPPLEVYHLAPAALVPGVVERTVDGAIVRVTTPARAVADAFRFRSRLGLDTAVDALRQVLGNGAASVAEIDEMADVARVRTVVRPYLEALG